MFKKGITLFTAAAVITGMIAGILTGMSRIGAVAAEKTTEAKAKEIALADAGLEEKEVTFDLTETGMEHGAEVYEVEFRTTEKEYDYDISIADGEIVSAGWELINPKAGGNDIDKAKAKEIVLADAGVKESDAVFTKTGSKTEDGIAVFELAFEDKTAEYDYDVAKAGGKILSRTRKVKIPACVAATRKADAGKQAAGKTGADGAIEAALNHAGLTANDVTGLKCEKDNDDGREIYEVEFKAGGYEYSYDIDADNYQVLEWEKEQDD